MRARTSYLVAGRAIAVVLLLSPAGWAIADGVEIRGRVRDDAGTPLPNVAVSVEHGRRTTTDAGGAFTLRVAAEVGQLTLRVEAEGFYPRDIALELAQLPGVLDVRLTPLKTLQEDVVVVARQDLPLAENPAGASIVGPDAMRTIPRAVAADETLRAVPGVKVDNQANGERVHISIRGQGILTERGVRGIEVLLDGIPLSDPSGFVPDLFDVDWTTVAQVGVLRGPVAFLYGGGSGSGVIDIRTRDGGPSPLAGDLWAAAGANGFYKARGEASGDASAINYRVSGSRTAGDGYREHSKFSGDNVYGKLRWRASEKLELHGILAGTTYFNENAEGLNLEQFNQDPRLPNPDALTFNEYQKTSRATVGLTGEWAASPGQRFSFVAYFRHTRFTESVPSSVQHRALDSPGGSLQYDLFGVVAGLTHHVTVGLDLDGQSIDEHRRPNEGGGVEGADLLSNETIDQGRSGAYVIERVGFGPQWTVLLGGHFDRITHRLTDRLKLDGVDLSGSRTFRRATGRVGVTWNPDRELTLYASWGQGFLPPATEELFANPDAFGGFNESLAPATSVGEEIGVRGLVGKRFSYMASAFHLRTSGDFERYRIVDRPLETFYRNAGHSRRWGLETSCAWRLVEPVAVTLAYTYSDFVYTQYPSITYGGDLSGRWLPNSPKHQLFVGASYERPQGFFAGAGGQSFSRAYIDATNQTWIDGYVLVDAWLGWRWQGRFASGRILVSGKNLFDKKYAAFTEPDPDGNSYHPGPGRELFAGVQLEL